MSKPFRRVLQRLRDRCLRPMLRRLDQQESLLRALADAHFRTRAMMKKVQTQPIRVVFACHEPAAWSMFESVYHAMAEDPDFSPIVVALPYRHSTLPEEQYRDAGMLEFCQARGIQALRGYDQEKDRWLSPAELLPDYVFFQTPYPLFPPAWSVEQVAMLARVCYIPYATLLSQGEIAACVHPEDFFKWTRWFFMENPLQRELLRKTFGCRPWLRQDSLLVTGHPKLDYLREKVPCGSTAWKRGMQNGITRILWTPRWRTSEGTCHFFDYKDFFRDFCRQHPDVDFTFRPHPLCLQNWLKTGEMTAQEQRRMAEDYATSPNMTIDTTANYADTFLTSDVLISDLSSMMVEYFATGKPIIYTHRRDIFNEYGRVLSTGLYWVRNVRELGETMAMLLEGKDPLHTKRRELMNVLFFTPECGAGGMITEHLRADCAHS